MVAIDAVTTSGTIESEEDGLVLYPSVGRVTGLHLECLLWCGSACGGRASQRPSLPLAPGHRLNVLALETYGLVKQRCSCTARDP